MRYLIVYLIKGKAERSQRKLMKYISDNFGIENKNERIPPHLTLKSPFDSENIEQIKKKLKDFCKNNESKIIYQEGFGTFDNKIIYLNYYFSDEAKKLFRSFTDLFPNKKYFDWNEFDLKEDNFHATLVNVKSNSKFREIIEYLKEKNLSHEMKFDNISVMKMSGNKWKLCKEFKIK